MATPAPAPAPDAAPAPRPRELTVRAVVVAAVVAAIMGASFPYVVLKIGYGPNISVVAAFFGFILLALWALLTRRHASVFECNMAQTAGTAAGEIGFMCIVLAAMDMLSARPELGFGLHVTGMQIFLWLTFAGLLGAFLAVPLRRHYIDEENLPFPDGTAAGETLVVLYRGAREARVRLTSLLGALGVSALFAVFRDQGKRWQFIPDAWHLGLPGAAALNLGTEVGVLSVGAGLLIGLRVTLSMGLGMVLAWVIAPPLLVGAGWVPHATFREVLKWVMWPATGLMVSGGLTALVLRWRVIARTFRNLSAKDVSGDEVPLRWVGLGALASAVALAVVQHHQLGFSYALTGVSILLSLPLMLVGIRVLGETNWAPISALANLMQAVFAGLRPHDMPVNMVGSGMSGTVAGQGEHLMQCYRSGRIIGSSNRSLLWMQILGIPIGAAAVAVVYPALRQTYGFEGPHALTSPISQKWAGFAELLAKGFAFLPHGCLTALAVGLALGVVITVLEERPALHRFVPSPSGIGLGMLVPGTAVLPMVVGGVVQWIWARRHPRSEAEHCVPVASGFIAGEALVVLVLSIAAAWSMVRGG